MSVSVCTFSRLEYFDEAVRDPASHTAVPVDIHQPPAFLHKILQLSAVQLFYDSTGTAQVMETWPANHSQCVIFPFFHTHLCIYAIYLPIYVFTYYYDNTILSKSIIDHI